MVNQLRKAILVALSLAAVLSACAPAPAAPDLQSQIATGVVMTVQAQNDMADAVAQTLTAQAPPLPTPTSSPTDITLNLPTVDPNIATATPFVVVPGTGSSGGSTGGTA